MKISELEKILSKLRLQYGDIEIEWPDGLPLTRVHIVKIHPTQNRVVVEQTVTAPFVMPEGRG